MTWICLNGATFDPNRLYEIVFKAANPLVLGIGYAATRDFVSFLHHETMAPGGGSNPISGTVTKTLGIGSSQSGAFLRALTFYGMNEDEDRRIVFDGIWPEIDGRMLWLNERFAQPTVLLQLYMGGEEAPVWWADFPNEARNLPPNGLLHRCRTTDTCPEVMETFGELEFYGEKMGPDMTGYASSAASTSPSRTMSTGTTYQGPRMAAALPQRALTGVLRLQLCPSIAAKCIPRIPMERTTQTMRCRRRSSPS